MSNFIRKSSMFPPLTKYDVITHLEKTRDIQDYLSNRVPMQSDKLKIRLINEGYLDPNCSICGMSRWLDGDSFTIRS